MILLESAKIETTALDTVPHVALAATDTFSPEEWDSLHKDDKLAGTAIVAIMITIFALGLIGYAVIALVALGG